MPLSPDVYSPIINFTPSLTKEHHFLHTYDMIRCALSPDGATQLHSHQKLHPSLSKKAPFAYTPDLPSLLARWRHPITFPLEDLPPHLIKGIISCIPMKRFTASFHQMFTIPSSFTIKLLLKSPICSHSHDKLCCPSHQTGPPNYIPIRRFIPLFLKSGICLNSYSFPSHKILFPLTRRCHPFTNPIRRFSPSR